MSEPTNIPDLNSKAYQREARDNFIPYVDQGAETETFLLKSVTQRHDAYGSKNAFHFLLTCLTTTRPSAVRVGTDYKIVINLDVPGQYDADGTPAFRAAKELSNITAALLGMSTKEADQRGVNLTAELNSWKLAGESVSEKCLQMELRSVASPAWEKDPKTKKPTNVPIIDTETGKQKVYTNRYYNACV